MKKSAATLFLFFIIICSNLSAQQRLDSIQFFIDEKPIAVNIVSDFKKLFNTKKDTPLYDATVSFTTPDNSTITEAIKIRARGKFRKAECYMPPLMLNFHNPTSPRLYQLKKLKLVSSCGTSTRDEQLILIEHFIYKMYNLVTPLSFRIRLARVTFEDVAGKTKKYTTWGFFIEDVDEMAKRNKHKEYEIATEQKKINPEQMTLVAIFEYLIGNTDWSVPNFHNIKLVIPKRDSIALPLPVPYDFDFSGMVNADYATPAEIMGTEKVTERVYRGFARPLQEINAALNILKAKRNDFNTLIMSCELLPLSSRKAIVKYFDEFYKIADNQREIQNIFIDEARKN